MPVSFVNGLTPSKLLVIFSSMLIFNSGASHHKLYDHKYFTSLNIALPMSVLSGDGTHTLVAGVEFISTTNLYLTDVYYIPNLTLSLISIYQFTTTNNISNVSHEMYLISATLVR